MEWWASEFHSRAQKTPFYRWQWTNKHILAMKLEWCVETAERNLTTGYAKVPICVCGVCVWVSLSQIVMACNLIVYLTGKSQLLNWPLSRETQNERAFIWMVANLMCDIFLKTSYRRHWKLLSMLLSIYYSLYMHIIIESMKGSDILSFLSTWKIEWFIWRWREKQTLTLPIPTSRCSNEQTIAILLKFEIKTCEYVGEI